MCQEKTHAVLGAELTHKLIKDWGGEGGGALESQTAVARWSSVCFSNLLLLLLLM